MAVDPTSNLPIVADSALLEQAIASNLMARTTYRGEMTFPCVPAALEDYLQQLQACFTLMGKPLSEGELAQVRQLLTQALEQGFQVTASAKLVVNYEITASPGLQKNLAFNAAIAVPSLAEQYRNWLETKQPPLFGSHPDAKVMAIVRDLPAAVPILDVGAGTGRNTLPLARSGYPVDALELTPEFADQLQSAASAENLPVTVIRGDVLEPSLQLTATRYHLVILSEVISHFRDQGQLRLALAKLSDAVVPGGLLLFNLFLAKDNYVPNTLVQQVSQVAWSCVFTRSQLMDAIAGLPLDLLSDESVAAYEQEHLPAGAYPPTGWFAAWSSGKSVFPLSEGKPPMELRWIVCRKG